MKLSRYIIIAGLSLPLQNIYAADETLSLQESILTDELVSEAVLDKAGTERAISTTAEPAKKTIGTDIAKSKNATIVSIPYSHAIALNDKNKYLYLKANLPVININDPFAGKNTGIGDISVGATYYIKSSISLMKFGASIKLPTGAKDKALGTGSTDFSVNFAYRKIFEKFHGTIRLGQILRGEGTVLGTKTNYGNSFTLAAAVD